MKPKILVVDDEPDVLDLVTYNLGQAGFQTLTAADGAEALRKAAIPFRAVDLRR